MSTQQNPPMWFDVDRQNVLKMLRKKAKVPEKAFLTYFIVDNETAEVVWGISVHDQEQFNETLKATITQMIRLAFSLHPHTLNEVHFHLDTSPH